MRGFITCVLHLIYSIRIIRSRMNEMGGHVERMGEVRNASEKLKGRDQLIDLTVDGVRYNRLSDVGDNSLTCINVPGVVTSLYMATPGIMAMLEPAINAPRTLAHTGYTYSS
jgi:hypothetical protein